MSTVVSKWMVILVAASGLIMVPNYKGKPMITWKKGPDVPLAKGGYVSGVLGGSLILAGGTYWKDGKKIWLDAASRNVARKTAFKRVRGKCRTIMRSVAQFAIANRNSARIPW